MEAGEEDPFDVIETNERELNEAAKAFRGADVSVIAPGDIRERTSRQAQSLVPVRLAGKQIVGPAYQSRRKLRDACLRFAEGLRTLDERVERPVVSSELRVEPTLT
jgi:hypothetical protein